MVSEVNQPVPNQPTDEQRQIAADFVKHLIQGRTGQFSYKPIIKALAEIGIEPNIMTVMIGDDPIDCLVIPTQELMTKEYKYMIELGNNNVT
jgi:hypothetical protein